MQTRLLLGLLLSVTGAGFAGAFQKTTRKPDAKQTGMPVGKAMIWEDRGQLTPLQVFWGPGGRHGDPGERMPQPPFSKFEKDDTKNAFSPKCRCTDSRGVKWTVKFGDEVRADVAAPRLAWALGFWGAESYIVPSGKIEGISASTDLGNRIQSGHFIKSDGSFSNARFKRHNKDTVYVAAGNGEDVTWSEAENPGVPAEQLSGLLVFDVISHNWDAVPKNCKVIHIEDGKSGPENWYLMDDMGAGFGWWRTKYRLSDYLKEQAYVQSVSKDEVLLSLRDPHPTRAAHARIPLAHAQWFRSRLVGLTDDQIRAAFNAAYADEALLSAYRTANADEIRKRTPTDVESFVKKIREKIEEFKAKVPEGS